MAIRIVTGGIAQETNTFQWEATTLPDFQKGSSGIVRGEDIIAMEGTGTIYGGIVAEAKRQGVELIPTTYGHAVPGGRVSREAFETMRDEILAGIRAALPVDGVLLGIHGAMALEHNDDGEGPLITAVRELVGPEVPIVAPLDLHTNLSEEMMAEATAFVGYKEYPHIDTPETGARAMQILVGTIKGEITPDDGARQTAADRAESVDGDDVAITAEDRHRPGAGDRAGAGRRRGDGARRLPLLRCALHERRDDCCHRQ